ncbi:hypothetical protein D3C76_1131400 [compost metagenome]
MSWVDQVSPVGLPRPPVGRLMKPIGLYGCPTASSKIAGSFCETDTVQPLSALMDQSVTMNSPTMFSEGRLTFTDRPGRQL